MKKQKIGSFIGYITRKDNSDVTEQELEIINDVWIELLETHGYKFVGDSFIYELDLEELKK